MGGGGSGRKGRGDGQNFQVLRPWEFLYKGGTIQTKNMGVQRGKVKGGISGRIFYRLQKKMRHGVQASMRSSWGFTKNFRYICGAEL